MSNEKFTQLPTVTNANLSDIICAVQAGVSSQETLNQVFLLMLANLVQNYAGNPNGNVSGTKYSFCWDTTDLVMYVCTTSGNASTAVWTLSGSTPFPISVSNGGTGDTSSTAYGLVTGGTTSTGAFQNAGTGTSGQIYVSGGNAALGTWTSATGTGNIVKATSPTLVTPTLGAATATTVNNVTITAPATGSTLTIADGKTLTASNTLTFTGTDSSSVALGSGGTVLYNSGALGTPSSGTLTNCTGLPFSGIASSAIGSFTANIAFGGASTGITYSTQFGQYLQIGKMVFISVGLQLTNVGSATGIATITGLPIACNSTSLFTFPLFFTNTTFTSGYNLVGLLNAGQTLITLATVKPAGGGDSPLDNTNFSNNSSVFFSGFYFTS